MESSKKDSFENSLGGEVVIIIKHKIKTATWASNEAENITRCTKSGH